MRPGQPLCCFRRRRPSPLLHGSASLFYPALHMPKNKRREKKGLSPSLSLVSESEPRCAETEGRGSRQPEQRVTSTIGVGGGARSVRRPSRRRTHTPSCDCRSEGGGSGVTAGEERRPPAFGGSMRRWLFASTRLDVAFDLPFLFDSASPSPLFRLFCAQHTQRLGCSDLRPCCGKTVRGRIAHSAHSLSSFSSHLLHV